MFKRSPATPFFIHSGRPKDYNESTNAIFHANYLIKLLLIKKKFSVVLQSKQIMNVEKVAICNDVKGWNVFWTRYLIYILNFTLYCLSTSMGYTRFVNLIHLSIMHFRNELKSSC